MCYLLPKKIFKPPASYDAKILHNLPLIKPEPVMMDIRLGDNLGSDLCKKVKTDPLTSHLRTVLSQAAKTRTR